MPKGPASLGAIDGVVAAEGDAEALPDTDEVGEVFAAGLDDVEALGVPPQATARMATMATRLRRIPAQFRPAGPGCYEAASSFFRPFGPGHFG